MIWALDADCDTPQGVPQNCSSVRGGGFNNTASSTFKVEEEFALDLNTGLGYTGGALYGTIICFVACIYSDVLQALILLDLGSRTAQVQLFRIR